jgi:hypothetical protein
MLWRREKWPVEVHFSHRQWIRVTIMVTFPKVGCLKLGSKQVNLNYGSHEGEAACDNITVTCEVQSLLCKMLP